MSGDHAANPGGSGYRRGIGRKSASIAAGFVLSADTAAAAPP
jgi:hypothetical protein